MGTDFQILLKFALCLLTPHFLVGFGIISASEKTLRIVRRASQCRVMLWCGWTSVGRDVLGAWERVPGYDGMQDSESGQADTVGVNSWSN